MCGICGILSTKHEPALRYEYLKSMAEVLHHRGPDEEGFYLEGPMGLGHKRLKIIDLDTGRQPISNEDESCFIVFNGEIYNFRALREELLKKGHRFKTKSDTEVILHLYEDRGVSCLEELRGMFAFAIWDRRKEQLFLARDRVGKKPLYYSEAAGMFLFSSEMKSFAQLPEWSSELNPDAVAQYFVLSYIPQPKTVFKHAKKLPPAHYALVRQNSIEIKRYWQVDFSHKTNLDRNDCEKKLLDLLTESTELRMQSDVSLGAFLSGGLDSSIIVALMSRLSRKPIKTFAIGFEHADFDETAYARNVAEYCQTEHQEFIVRPQAIKMLPKLLWHYGEPYADSSSLASFYLAELTRKHVTVALNGDGGDESFAGYPRYRAAALIEQGKSSGTVPFIVMSLLGYGILSLFSEGKRSKGFFSRAKKVLDVKSSLLGENYANWMCCFKPETMERLLTPQFRKSASFYDAEDFIVSRFDEVQHLHFLDQLLYTDINTYLPEDLLVKMDVATMAYSLEARSPFLDHNVLEFAASLPPEMKLHGLESKSILKSIAKDLLPKEIIGRPKMGFGVPVGEWFQNELKEYVKSVLLSDQCRDRNILNQDFVSSIVKEHASGWRNHGYQLWNLLMFELWCRMYIDQEKNIFDPRK